MYERLQNLSSQVLTIGLSILALYIYLKIINRWLKKQPYDNIEWLKKNQVKLYFLAGMPMTIICTPMLEEFFFRLPLIVLFNDVSGGAWLGIFVSAILFGAIHYLNPKSFYVSQQILDAGKNKGIDAKCGDVAKEVIAKEKKTIMVAQIAQVIATFFFGLLSGYFGIKYQSLYVSVGLHAAWNLFMPFILVIVALILLLPAELITNYFVKRRLRKTFEQVRFR